MTATLRHRISLKAANRQQSNTASQLGTLIATQNAKTRLRRKYNFTPPPSTSLSKTSSSLPFGLGMSFFSLSNTILLLRTIANTLTDHV